MPPSTSFAPDSCAITAHAEFVSVVLPYTTNVTEQQVTTTMRSRSVLTTKWCSPRAKSADMSSTRFSRRPYQGSLPCTYTTGCCGCRPATARGAPPATTAPPPPGIIAPAAAGTGAAAAPTPGTPCARYWPQARRGMVLLI